MIKRIKGSGGGGKDGGGSARAPIEDPDSLRSIQYAKIIDVVSEGEIEGLVNGFKSVFLDDTPLQNDDGTFNFNNVIVEQRTGTQSQNYITGFDGAESENGVGTEVTKVLSVTRTITNTDATAVRVTLGFPQLNNRDLTTGDLKGTSVEIAIDIQSNGGGFVAQPLRQIFDSSVFSVASGVYTNTVESTNFRIYASWVGQEIQAPQTITFEVQYRPVGSVDWLVQTTQTLRENSEPPSGIGSVGNTDYPSGEKTFEFELPYDFYEFRLVKITGSIKELNGLLTTTKEGINFGGEVSISLAEAYVPGYTDVIDGKCTSRYQRAYRIELPTGGEWDVRVRRITDDSEITTLQNKTFWDSYTEIVDARLRYPNTAYYGIKIDSKNFSSIPVRGYEIYGVKVQIPSNYDPLTRVYTGTWDGTFITAWSDNPAWILYDIIVSDRYGTGTLIDASQVDKWSLYTIGQYCDEMVPDGFGGIEPRFTCNVFLQTREEAYRVISNLSSIFRSVAYWAAGEIVIAQDSPSDAVQLFTPSNIIGGQFQYSGSSGKVRHTVVLVSWNDPQDGYRAKVEYVADTDAIARYGIVQTELAGIGCTSRGQAHRMGRALIYSEINETETVSFTAGLDTVFCGVGSVIKTQDPIRSGRRSGGRTLTGSTTSSIVIDSEMTFESGKTYELNLIMPDGTIETRSVTNSAGINNVVTVSLPFSQVPLNYSIWVMSASDLVPEQWRIVSMTEVEKTQIQITALSYYHNKYVEIEENLILEPLPTSLLSASQPVSVENLTVTESLYLSGLSVVATKAIVSWNTSISANTYRLEYTPENENPIIINGLTTNTYEIAPIQEGNYRFRVYSVNALGRRSQPTMLDAVIYGKTTPPNDVTDFNMIALSGYAHLTWAQSTDLDVLVGGSMRIRFTPDLATPSWSNASDIGFSISGNSTSATLPLLTGSYIAKWVDSTGNESVNESIITSDAASLITLNVFSTLAEAPTFAGSKTNVELDGSVLRLSSGLNVDSYGNVDDVTDWDGAGDISPTGTYLFNNTLDLGSVQTSRLISDIEMVGVDELNNIDDVAMMDDLLSIDGNLITDIGIVLYVRTTNDDPAGTPTWSEWQQFFVGDWTARAFEFKAELFSDNITHNINVSKLSVIIDMPDRDEYGDDITSGVTTYTVTYTVPFKANPALSITAQNMGTGDYYTISNKTETGFDIDFYNAAATQVSRVFDYHAKGY